MLIGKIKEVKFLKNLIGRQLPTNVYGHAGREFENIAEQDYHIEVNRGKGPDSKMYGIEFKTRDVDAVSPQTIATMQISDIIKTPYEESAVFEKFQQQIRIKTQNCIIVEATLYDFRPAYIQDHIKTAYNYARQQIIKDPTIEITKSGPFSEGRWGYFENSNKRKNSRAFRVSHYAMLDFEKMAKNNFSSIFNYYN